VDRTLKEGVRQVNDENPNITAILEHYGATVPTRNGWAKMKCPFHNDSHASAAVNLQDNLFKCHGCQYKGSGYKIIMDKEGVSFREAISIAEGILNQSGQVLPRRTGRGGRISGRSRNNNGASDSRALGRRLRAVNGS
jgi:DNA primase